MFPVGMEVNATSPESYPEFQVADKLWKYCSPIMIALGTIGNVFCIVTLLRKNLRRQTTVIYLVTLSVNDLVVLYSGLLRQWMLKAFDLDIRHLSEFSCKLHLWVVYLSLDSSAWILVVVTLERVALVWFPHASKSKCNKKVAAVILSSLVGTMMLINSHLLFGVGNVTTINGNSTVLKICFYENQRYQDFFVNVWPWIDLAKFNALPFVIILIGNICIVSNVIKNHRKVHRTVAPQGTQQRLKKLNSMSATLIVLNTAFLVSTTPISIYLAFYEKWTKNASFHDKARLQLAWAVVNLLMYSNNTLNFLLYCVSGGNFRKEIRHLCRGATQNTEATRATTLVRRSIAKQTLSAVG
ncbi:cysteinyl leukotriene receptor 1-like isoform X1 [Crassostrea virginica]